MENFKKKLRQSQELHNQQQQQRQGEEQGQPRGRANSSSGARASSQSPPPNKPSATAGHTPPTRRAPALPKDKGTGGSQRRRVGSASESVGQSPAHRKPHRPAPAPPEGRRRSGGPRLSQEVPIPQSPANGEVQFGLETPPPHYSASLPTNLTHGQIQKYWPAQNGNLESDQDGFGTLESGENVIMDLSISQTDQEHSSSSPGEDSLPPPIHIRSASDSLILMQSASNSLPDLVGEDSSSPDVLDESGRGQGGGAEEAAKSSNHSYKHTRSMSLVGAMGEKGFKERPHASRKKKPRRAGSVKQRSRSPPNLPPPPPPEINSQEESDGALGADAGMVDQGGSSSQERDPSLQNNKTAVNVGFNEVLTTISNIDQQLDELSDEFIIKAPQNSTHATTGLTSLQDVCLVPSPVPEEEGEGDKEFQEDEWLCDIPSQQLGDKEVELELNDHDVGPELQIVSSISDHSPSHPQVSGEKTAKKTGKGKHRVMFKEEVEDIPSYEPRVDQVVPITPEEELPVGVAAIKMKLFGRHEQEAARYKKDGILSPKYTHPTNITFTEDYFSKSPTHRDSSPNANNNNSEEEPPETPVINGGEHIPKTQGPWEQQKYKVIGVRRRTNSNDHVKEKTPPPTHPKKPGLQIKYAEVSVKETPKPFATEVRNVHSLERKELKKRAHQSPPTTSAEGGNSLLASINDTLHVTSRYGSDSFLSNGETEHAHEASKHSSPGIMSSRGELEKIRAAHRKEAHTTPQSTPLNQLPHFIPLSQAAKPMQHSSPHIFSPPIPTTSLASGSGSGLAAMGGSPSRSVAAVGGSPSRSGDGVAAVGGSPSRSGGGVAAVGVGGSAPNRSGLAVVGGGARKPTPSLEGLQRRQDTQVTYDQQSQAHFFRSLV